MEKKLYKNKEKGQLFGVCQGIAEYFELDPSLVRIGWAFTFFFAGTGLLVYLILALVLPDIKEVN